MKRILVITLSAGEQVAPRAGAWIETGRPWRREGVGLVAPRAGAWIETARVCTARAPKNVAPRAGAWIETVVLVGS